MVKLKSPLHSSSASGSLADRITFINIGGKPYAKIIQKKTVSKSSAQESLREVFKAATALAKELTDEQKSYYDSLDPDSAACPWWNNFVSEYIKENWPVSADVNSFTRKRPPAVADLQAVHSFVRVVDGFTIIEAGTYAKDIYTVPEGFIFRQQALSCQSNSGDPTTIAYLLRYDETDVVYYSEIYGAAWTLHISTTPVTYDQFEKVRIQFAGCEIDNHIYWSLFGYLTNKY